MRNLKNHLHLWLVYLNVHRLVKPTKIKTSEWQTKIITTSISMQVLTTRIKTLNYASLEDSHPHLPRSTMELKICINKKWIYWNNTYGLVQCKIKDWFQNMIGKKKSYGKAFHKVLLLREITFLEMVKILSLKKYLWFLLLEEKSWKVQTLPNQKMF